MVEVMENRHQLFLFVPKHQLCKARRLWSQERAVCTANLPGSKKTQLLEAQTQSQTTAKMRDTG